MFLLLEILFCTLYLKFTNTSYEFTFLFASQSFFDTPCWNSPQNTFENTDFELSLNCPLEILVLTNSISGVLYEYQETWVLR